MSLRDQLLKAGLASKKDVRKANQVKRKERKEKQSKKARQKQRLAEEEAARQAALEEERLAKLTGRREREAIREAHEQVMRVRQVILSNRMGAKGPVVFFHKGLDGRMLHRMRLPEKVAFGLRCGELAIAGLREADDQVSYHVIRRRGADKLDEIGEDLVVFRVRDTQGISRPEEAFLRQEWDPSLRPHRARVADTMRDRGP